MEERIQDQPWFQKTVDELREYRVLVKRIRVIEILLRKDVSPDAKAIANYGINTYGGQNPDEISKLEVELEEKQTRLRAIEASLESLEPRELEIIEAKFKQGKKDKEIYESLFISSDTFYNGKPGYNTAIEKIAKCLGYLEC
jgi:DNA-binding NarL/FixJ family response regulator